MHHYHRHMLIAVHGRLILHIHLVDGYVAFHAGARPGGAATQRFGSFGFAAYKEAALRCHHQRFGRVSGVTPDRDR